MKSLSWWTTPHVFVKPVSDCALFDEWIVLNKTPLQSVRDDMRRAGWRVAMYNAITLLRTWLDDEYLRSYHDTRL